MGAAPLAFINTKTRNEADSNNQTLAMIISTKNDENTKQKRPQNDFHVEGFFSLLLSKMELGHAHAKKTIDSRSRLLAVDALDV
jgi:hypothetical protein